MPLYNEVTPKEFYEYYEIAVGKKARALFIHRGIGADQIEKEFDTMVEKGLRYHMHDFRVHGIGTQNVAHIKKFFAKKTKNISENDKFIFQRTYESSSEIPAIEYTVTFI